MPLVVSSSLFFPFITGKAFVFRIIVEIIFACYLILAIRDASYRPKYSWVLVSVVGFLAVVALADIFAENPFKAFWSNYERMEGFVSLIHFGAYFLVLGSVFKTRRMWNALLATSLGASLIMSIYSFFQLAGKIAINQGGVRVDGTLGNASYLGIYMVFHIFFAALLFAEYKTLWKRVLLAVVALLNLIILYYTATRGAILGLIGGALITFIFLALKSEKGSSIKKIALSGLIAVFVFAGLFIAVRNNSLVKNNPVLGRFATLSFSEIKTQGRYFVWPMAIKGFLDRPILGWGQEGFNFVFNKYYDPRMYNQEPWFDRAHNTFLDWLAAGGALGLLSYLSILAALFYCLFKSKNDNMPSNQKAIILGMVSAYLFNNLFVFDQISSYILFFTVLAFVHFNSPENQFNWFQKITFDFKWLESEKNRPIIEALVVIFILGVLYFVVYGPWQQNKDLLNVLSLNNQGKIGAIEDYAKPLSGYDMGFPESLEHISQTAISMASNQSVPVEFKQKVFNLVDAAFKKQLTKVPNDARYRLFDGLFLSRYGMYDKAVEQLKEAQSLSPKKQQIYFELVNNFILSGKTAEAVQAAKNAYELEPSYEDAKFVYAFISLMSGDSNTFNQLMKDVPESKLVFDDRYLNALLITKQYQQMINVVQKRIALEPTNLQHRMTLAAAYLQAGRRQEAIQSLEELIKLQPSFKEQGEYYINEIKAGRNP